MSKRNWKIAKQLAKLNVDVIEAEVCVASPGDFQSIKEIAEQVRPRAGHLFHWPGRSRAILNAGLGSGERGRAPLYPHLSPPRPYTWSTNSGKNRMR